MFEFIALIILVLSLCGIFVILFKKAPVLATMPRNGNMGIKKHPVILEIKAKLRVLHFDLFVKKLLLHKILSYVKVLTLKIEARVDSLLHGIRKNAQKIDRQTKRIK